LCGQSSLNKASWQGVGLSEIGEAKETHVFVALASGQK